jgi:hypothetical protein
VRSPLEHALTLRVDAIHSATPRSSHRLIYPGDRAFDWASELLSNFRLPRRFNAGDLASFASKMRRGAV